MHPVAQRLPVHPAGLGRVLSIDASSTSAIASIRRAARASFVLPTASRTCAGVRSFRVISTAIPTSLPSTDRDLPALVSRIDRDQRNASAPVHILAGGRRLGDGRAEAWVGGTIVKLVHAARNGVENMTGGGPGMGSSRGRLAGQRTGTCRRSLSAREPTFRFCRGPVGAASIRRHRPRARTRHR
jgi:hypothetical protein